MYKNFADAGVELDILEGVLRDILHQTVLADVLVFGVVLGFFGDLLGLHHMQFIFQ